MFLRGNGSQTRSGVTYTSSSFGTFQADSFLSHNHTIPNTFNFYGSAQGGGSADVVGWQATASNTSSSGGTETRPANFSVNYIIKF